VSVGAQLLVVEDDRNVGATLVDRLRGAGYRVTLAESAARARAAWRAQAPQLVLMDVGLPDGNGFELAAEFRAAVPQAALVFLTAHGNPDQRVRGLELGADDYVTKPFHFKELLLRIHNCLKRAQDLAELPGEMRGVVRIGRARVDFERFSAEAGGEVHALTHKECAVLRLLASRVGKAVSRDEILDRAWSADEFPTSRTVDNFIVRLRRLVEPGPGEPQVIRSIRGVGYLLTEVARE
jgi:two-component system alkaline phosphatase synthesis response regulator PhoP